MKTILMAVLAGVFLVSLPFKAAQAEDKAPEAAKDTKGKKEKGDKKDDSKKETKGGGGW